MGVSIVIPSFERPELLEKLLLSVSKQTFLEFEVFVIDDCSVNLSEIKNIIAKFTTQMKIELLVNSQRMGAPHSRNRGILLAQYEFIALVDDDDEWFPDKLAIQYKMFLESSFKVGLIYTWTQVINPMRMVLYELKGEIEGNARNDILETCFIPSPSVMVRKKSIIDAGLFDENFPSCQDWDTWTRIIFAGYEVKVCREFLTYYLKHDGPTIGTSPKAKLGFILYYQKHFFKLLIYRKFRHLIRLFRLKTGI